MRIGKVLACLGALILVSMAVTFRHMTASFKQDRDVILLNVAMPEFSALCETLDNPSLVAAHKALRKYLDYYAIVNELRPGNDHVALFQGYLFSLGNDWSKAGAFFIQAMRADRPFIFSHYNAALADFRLGKYSSTVSLLEQALGIPVENNIQVMLTSKIYRQLLSAPNAPKDIIPRLKKVYQDAYLLLLKSLFLNGQYAAALNSAVVAARSFPDEADFFFYAGWASIELGKPEVGEAFLLKAKAMSPEQERLDRMLDALILAKERGSGKPLKIATDALRQELGSDQERKSVHARIL